MLLFKKILSLFKKKEEIKQLPKEFSFQEIDEKVKEIQERIAKEQNQIKEEIQERIARFDSEILESIRQLEAIDIEKRRDFDKLKSIVKENLKSYINYLKRLQKNLKEITELCPEEYFKKIYSIMSEFVKLSNVSFERATILIGKEMEDVAKRIKIFLNDLDILLKKSDRHKNKKINQIIKIINEIRTTKKYYEKKQTEIINLQTDLERVKEELTLKEKLLENILNSNDYKKEEEMKKVYKMKLQDFENKLYKIKEKINFKELLNKYHLDKKKKEIIESYRNNFKESLLEQDENLFQELIEDKKEINLSALKQEYLNLKDPFISPIDSSLNEIKGEISKLNSKINDYVKKIKEEKLKQERFFEKINKMESELKIAFTDLIQNFEN